MTGPSVSTRAAGSWRVGGASALGAAHIRRNQPNQDAITWSPAAGHAGSVVAAVADGHGASPHYRSEIGSRLAVEAAAQVLVPFLDSPAPELDPSVLPRRVVETWHDAVLAHIGAHPLTGDWVEAASDKLLPYGATLIAFAACDRFAVAIQIGDGDLLLGYPDGRIARPLPDDAGLVGEQTYSLCSSDAVRRFRVCLIRHDDGAGWPDFAMLSTDGVSKSFADEAAFRAVGTHYHRAVRAALFPSVLEPLGAWLGDVSRRGSGDDATLCLVSRSGDAPQQESDDHVW